MKVVPLDNSALEQGIGLFNRGEYFDAHEAWDGLWFRATDSRDKRFLQGLIMAAGAFHQAKKRKCSGATVLLAKSIPLLRSGVAIHPDLQLSDFIQELEQLRSEMDWCSNSEFAQKLPRITREYACCGPRAEGMTV